MAYSLSANQKQYLEKISAIDELKLTKDQLDFMYEQIELYMAESWLPPKGTRKVIPKANARYLREIAKAAKKLEDCLSPLADSLMEDFNVCFTSGMNDRKRSRLAPPVSTLQISRVIQDEATELAEYIETEIGNHYYVKG